MKSIEDFKKEVEREDKIRKSNELKIEKFQKEIKLILESSHELNIDTIIDRIKKMKEFELSCMHTQTLKAYAKFHSGRASGMQTAIELLITIKNKNK